MIGGILKRFKTFCLVALIFCTTAIKGIAAEITDVSQNYWAYPEIHSMVEAGLMTLNSKNQFRPNDSISRTDFVATLLKICDFKNSPVSSNPYFKDLNTQTRNLNEILTSQQLKIIYGYPDKTFKPEAPTKRSESSSAVAHIVNSTYDDSRILNSFEDEDKIPIWAVDSYIQNTANDFNVNYPNPKRLEPNKNLTRSQAAVLLIKVHNYTKKNQVSTVEPEDNRIKEVFIKNETLDIYPDAPRNIVEIYNTKTVIGAGNVLIGSFTSDFVSKKSNINDVVQLVANKDVSTVEGRAIYPAGTVFSGRVHREKFSTWLDKKDKSLFVLNEIIFPEGAVFDMAGVPLTKGSKVIYTKGKDKSKSFFVDFGGNKKELTKTEFLVNFSNKVSPTIKYKNKNSDEVYILLTGDLIIQHVDPALIKRERL